MFATNNFTRLFATTHAIETYLNLETISIIETRSAIILTLKLKIIALYFLIKSLELIMLALFAKMQRTILLSIDQMR